MQLRLAILRRPVIIISDGNYAKGGLKMKIELNGIIEYKGLKEIRLEVTGCSLLLDKGETIPYHEGDYITEIFTVILTRKEVK